MEGGGVVCTDEHFHDICKYMRNFGHDGQERYFGLGINAKLSELHSAMGLINLKYIDSIIEGRKVVSEAYAHFLNEYQRPLLREGTGYNYAYFPIILEKELQINKAVNALAKEGIFPRRYFYPSLTSLPYIHNESCPISEDISKRVLCLPLYEDLLISDVERIAHIVNES